MPHLRLVLGVHREQRLHEAASVERGRGPAHADARSDGLLRSLQRWAAGVARRALRRDPIRRAAARHGSARRRLPFRQHWPQRLAPVREIAVFAVTDARQSIPQARIRVGLRLCLHSPESHTTRNTNCAREARGGYTLEGLQYYCWLDCVWNPQTLTDVPPMTRPYCPALPAFRLQLLRPWWSRTQPLSLSIARCARRTVGFRVLALVLSSRPSINTDSDGENSSRYWYWCLEVVLLMFTAAAIMLLLLLPVTSLDHHLY